MQIIRIITKSLTQNLIDARLVLGPQGLPSHTHFYGVPEFLELYYGCDHVTEVAPATITQNVGGILDRDSDSDQQDEYTLLWTTE